MAIISFRHNFIFIKTRKTAGTSIEVDLSAIAGDDAIVTPILPVEDGHQPRNYLGPDGNPLFFNHMTAADVREKLTPGQFAGMFKFCVERDPVEKCISHFHMLRNSSLHNPDGRYTASWDEFCRSRRIPIDVEKYSEEQAGNRVLLVDRVLRYDQLAEALPQTLRGLGVEGFEFRSRAKTEYSRDRLVTPEMVTGEQRQLIRDAFAASSKVSGIEW